IALAVGSAGGARLTETGLSVGTPYYMSPEQATGDVGVGPAADIYALSAVLYEMLTGEPPYTGNTAQAVLGRIIQGGSVSARAVRSSVPRNVDAAIRKGLEKLPADRFTSAAQVADALQDPAFRHGEERVAPGTAESGPLFKAMAAAIVVLGLGLSAAVYALLTQPDPRRPVERFAMPFLPGQELEYTGSAGYRLAPDGSILVYRHNPEGGPEQVLMARRWDELSATRIRETTGAQDPVISPDGLELAFEQGGEVKALALAGGPVRTLMSPGYDPIWGHDGYVYARADSGMVRAPSGGGAVEDLTDFGADDGRRPFDLLPDGERLLYGAAVEDFQRFEIRVLDLGSGESTYVTDGTSPRYLPGPGLLVYLQDGVMMAVPFDPGAVEMEGTPVAIMDGLAHFSIADDGKLFYTRGLGGGVDQMMRLVWVDREGNVEPIDPDWTFMRGGADTWWSVSPDGTRLAVRELNADGNDIWIKQLDDGPRSRLTFGDSENWMPEWGPEPGEITFTSDRDGNLDVWTKRADGTGEPRLIVDMEQQIATFGWSPDGEWLVLRTAGPRGVEGGRDIYAFRPGVDTVPQPLLANSEYDEMYPQISPDGRWLAYQTTETDRHEIYVRPFPDVGSGRWQISVDGGRNPQWSHSGDELFFQGPNREMMVVDVETSGGFSAGTPRTLFQNDPDWIWGDILGNIYDVHPDDQRFVLGMAVGSDDDDDDAPDAVLVTNFLQVLRSQTGR
ncbi:MAG: hypothetical protein R3304_08750, partial [Longimicrobiales bacterium]|nr:hypothetical protein [Longimicrobiales bacterium]